MITTSFLQMLPILLTILAGYLFSSTLSIKVEDLIKIVTDFLLPPMIFISLTQSTLTSAALADITKASFLTFLLLLIVGFVWLKLIGEEIPAALPSLIFMNAGFLGIPLMKLWGGSEAMNLILVYDQVQNALMYSLGIFIITGGFTKRGLLFFLASPILWAIILGFIFTVANIPTPSSMVHALSFIGEAAAPMAGFALGLSIRRNTLTITPKLLGSIAVRFIGGYLVGLSVATLLGLEGVIRTVIIVTATLPSAMLTSLLPLRWGRNNQFASSMVVLTTLVSILTIPLAFALAG